MAKYIKTLNLEYTSLRRLVCSIGTPKNNLDRYILKSHIDKLEELKYKFRKAGMGGDAMKVASTIEFAKANLAYGN